MRKRLTEFRKLKQEKSGTLVGVLGCMAERLKAKFLEEEKLVDIVVGPDAYRTLPGLILEAESGQRAVNVLLSRDETYADIAPIRLNSNGVNAFVSIMRGCNNMCAFCVVPFTRGRVRIAQINQKNTEYIEQTTRTQLSQAVEQAYFNMTAAQDRYKVTTDQVAAFKESFRSAEIRFNEGAITSVDYVIAKNNMDRANLNLISARYDYVLRTKILDYYQSKPLW